MVGLFQLCSNWRQGQEWAISLSSATVGHRGGHLSRRGGLQSSFRSGNSMILSPFLSLLDLSPSFTAQSEEKIHHSPISSFLFSYFLLLLLFCSSVRFFYCSVVLFSFYFLFSFSSICRTLWGPYWTKQREQLPFLYRSVKGCRHWGNHELTSSAPEPLRILPNSTKAPRSRLNRRVGGS